MPFDLVKVTVALTLVFLASSLYLTVKESPTFLIYQNVSYVPLLLSMFAIFGAIIFILGYTKIISERSKLRYWGYLRGGLFIHMAATFYVFALIALLWNELSANAKLLSVLFGSLAFAFYLFYALDMRKVVSDLGIKAAFNKLDVARYMVSLYSGFFLIFFGISFTYGKTFAVIGGIDLESYPFLLFFTAVFLVAYTTFLSVTHKGFEEMMKKNVWSELSYISSFLAFIMVYFIYTSAQVQRFPLHDLFFVGYFTVLVIEIASIRTLGIQSKYRREKKDIESLFGFHTSACLRADYLEKIWEKIAERYGNLDSRLAKIRYDPSTRTFNIKELDERVKVIVATAMLFEMYQAKNLNKITTAPKSRYELKKDIEGALKEKILLLPEDLRSNFDEEKFYPMLYERSVNDLIEATRTFVPLAEQKTIFGRLKRVDPFFKSLTFKGSEIKLNKDLKTEIAVALMGMEKKRFSREDFVKYLKMYLNSIEEVFPFEDVLLYESVKDVIRRELHPYGFSAEELLDIVPTGFKPIDEISGGLRRGTSTLLLAEETRVKNEFLSSFVLQGLRDGDNNVYATSRRASEEVYNALIKDLEVKHTTIIDLYQAIHTPNPVPEILEDGYRMVIPPTIISLKVSITKAIKGYPKEDHKRVVLDMYSDLFKYYSERELFKVLYKQLEGFRKWNCTSITTLDPGLLSRDSFEEARKRFDNVLIIYGRGKEAFMTISKMYGGTPQKRVISLRK
jgi:KaiC/GvpD/RAD55 family RecA-like ATPase